MVLASTLLAVLIGIPLGILISRRPGWNKPVLGSANVIQTIPALRFLDFCCRCLGLERARSVLAILRLRSTRCYRLDSQPLRGHHGVDPAVVEAGRGMGMTDRQLLCRVELPLALGVIIAGVRVATVISVGLATIAAALGGGTG